MNCPNNRLLRAARVALEPAEQAATDLAAWRDWDMVLIRMTPEKSNKF